MFSVNGDVIFSGSRILKQIYLELYIPSTICVFGGAPLRSLAWLSTI